MRINYQHFVADFNAYFAYRTPVNAASALSNPSLKTLTFFCYPVLASRFFLFFFSLKILLYRLKTWSLKDVGRWSEFAPYADIIFIYHNLDTLKIIFVGYATGWRGVEVCDVIFDRGPEHVDEMWQKDRGVIFLANGMASFMDDLLQLLPLFPSSNRLSHPPIWLSGE